MLVPPEQITTESTDAGAAAADGGDAVAEFAAHWGLDAQAVEYLRSLEEPVRSTILAEFAPRDNTHDVAGKLYGFARSIISQQTKNNNMTPELEAFALRWSLDGAAVAWLLGLPPEVSSILVEQFDPKEDTHNIIGKMRSFARSIQARIPAMGTSTAEAGYLEALALSVSEFAAKWGLEDSALGLLRKLPPAVQTTVIEQFDPRGETVNVNGKLCAFARSIAAGRQVQGPHAERHFSEAEAFRQEAASNLAASGAAAGAADAQAAATAADPVISEFVIRWGLDASCVTLLESLPDDARTKVLEQFDPRDNTRNVSAKLRAFANTVVTGQGRSQPSAAPAATERQAAGVPHPAPAAPDPVEEMAFLERWGLTSNPTALDVLRRLHPPVRARVMREFAPGQDTHDVFGKFCGFSASVAKAAAKEGASGLPPLKAPSARLSAAAHGLHGALAAAGANQSVLAAVSDLLRPPPVLPRPAGVGMTPEQFADKWQLDAGSRALLSGLEPEAQATVIQEFQPRGETRDTSGKFCAFARSVAARLQSTPGTKRGLSPGQLLGPAPVRPRL